MGSMDLFLRQVKLRCLPLVLPDATVLIYALGHAAPPSHSTDRVDLRDASLSNVLHDGAMLGE